MCTSENLVLFQNLTNLALENIVLFQNVTNLVLLFRHYQCLVSLKQPSFSGLAMLTPPPTHTHKTWSKTRLA